MTEMETDTLKEWILQKHVEQLQALSAFREQWASSHSELNSEVSHLKEQVTKQNGNVADLRRESEALKKSLYDHKDDCPLFATVNAIRQELDRGEYPPAKDGVRMVESLQEQINSLRKSIDTQEARQQATVGTVSWVWKELGRPIVGGLVAALLVLILYHAFVFESVPKIGK
jgi:chromosome segregation ATPase